MYVVHMQRSVCMCVRIRGVRVVKIQFTSELAIMRVIFWMQKS